MPILLVRHGDSLPPIDRDSSRILSARGRHDTRALARRVRAAGLLPDAYVSSDFVRAVQTAEVLAHALGHEGVIEAEPVLQPGGDADACVAKLSALDAKGLLVVAVTHEPIVREIAAELLGVSRFRAFATSEAILVTQRELQTEFRGQD